MVTCPLKLANIAAVARSCLWHALWACWHYMPVLCVYALLAALLAAGHLQIPFGTQNSSRPAAAGDVFRAAQQLKLRRLRICRLAMEPALSGSHADWGWGAPARTGMSKGCSSAAALALPGTGRGLEWAA